MSSDEHQRLVIHFNSICAFCDSSLGWKNGWIFLRLGGDLTNRLWCFRCKAFFKSDTVAGLMRIVSLKWCKILVCLRNFNCEMLVVLNLAPCTFTCCWRGGSHVSQRLTTPSEGVTDCLAMCPLHTDTYVWNKNAWSGTNPVLLG